MIIDKETAKAYIEDISFAYETSGAFNNYVDKMRGGRGSKNVCFCPLSVVRISVQSDSAADPSVIFELYYCRSFNDLHS